MNVGQADGTVRDEMVLTGSNVEQTIGGAIPSKTILMGVSDGTNIRAVSGKVQGTLLASAARTATTTSPVQTNYTAKGIQVILSVTVASGVGGLQVFVRGKDLVSGQSYNLNGSPTSVIATGTYVYEIYPDTNGTTGQIVQSSNHVLPISFDVLVLHGDATSYTYSAAYVLLP